MLQQKRMFKVLAPIQRTKDGKTWFMRVGNGFENKDQSINLYLDAMPSPSQDGSYKLQIRELDDQDLRKREAYSSRAAPAAAGDAIPF